MDGSGMSPSVLKTVVYLGSHLTYRESQEVLALQGINLSSACCEKKHHGYTEQYETLSKSELEKLAQEPLNESGNDSQTWVIEIDGTMVMERDKPDKGQCEGREVKLAALFPLNEPQQCNYISQAGDLERFSMLNHGLQRHVTMQQNDKLIGLADGALWIDNLFDELGIDLRILDVFHATQYLEIIMQAMGWDADKRNAERASWCRGDINARAWLRHYLPEPQIWLLWSDDAQNALRYLEKRLDQMDYADFREQEYPIGSGVIEGAAKSIIATRMKRSGMRWSSSGINRMATIRTHFASYDPILDFDDVRFVAFP